MRLVNRLINVDELAMLEGVSTLVAMTGFGERFVSVVGLFGLLKLADHGC